MNWIISFFGSLVMLLVAGVLAACVSKNYIKKTKVVTPLNILLCGVFAASLLAFWPIYLELFRGHGWRYLKTLLIAAHNALRLFIVDGEYTFILEYISEEAGWIYTPYTVLAAVLFIVAPFFTFGFVLSFFKNISAYRRYLQNYFKEVCIFSELNDKSLALARDLKANNRKRLIVFTDVFDSGEETAYELLERAEAIGALLFKKDIVTIRFAMHSRQKNLLFFTIGNDYVENANQALELIRKYKNRENTSLYVFSTGTESELLLGAVDKGRVRVRRVNEVQSLVSRTLYDDGYGIFRTAAETGDGIKQISAVVLGMGLHGTEMTKALSWFCQMDGYAVEINAFDQRKNAASVFAAGCPELMDDVYNGAPLSDGEASYRIHIHDEVDVTTAAFTDKLLALPSVTYVFVALGNDELNITTAIRLRTLFERAGMDPKIHAVVYSTHKKEALTGITNFKKQPYRVEFIGDLKTSYSEDVILDSDVEAAALARHMKWGEEEEFWQYEYNYRSSIASAIHRKMKIACGIPGAEKPVEERGEEEKWALRKLEHKRWNAYMRSEGYCHAPVRNDLAKTHHCLVPFDQLSQKDQEKDDD